jgi:hypothetical protein
MTVARRKAAHARRGHRRRTGAADVNPHDALVLLTADHNEIEKRILEFERVRKTDDSVAKGKAALRICRTFAIYAAVKHEVFFPAAEAVLEADDRELVGKARVEHDSIGRLIGTIEATPAGDPSFDASVLVLADRYRRLMQQEEERLFPRLRHSRLDLQGTGERMAARTTELGTAPIDRDSIRKARAVMGGRH